MPMRRHQSEIESRGREIARLGLKRSTTVLDVVPGGGKSRCITSLYRSAEMRGKVVWVAPRKSLQSQAVEAAAEGVDGKGTGGLLLAENVHDFNRNPKGFDGFVTSYSMLAKRAGMHCKLYKSMPPGSMLVLDEVHHCGIKVESETQPGWTAASQRMFDVTNSRGHSHLLLTGTAYRGDMKPVLGLNYGEDGRITATPSSHVITYGRRQAVLDKAITPNRMYWLDGPTTFTIRENGEDVPYQLSSFRDVYRMEGSNAKKMRFARAALKAFLSWDSIESAHVPAIKQAWADLQFHRKKNGFRGAQMIVTARSQAHASVLAEIMRNRLGIKTALAVSDYGPSLDELFVFRQNKGAGIPGVGVDALVTVGMAYEGLDAPFVTHLVHLGHIRQPSWLMQYFARAWRWGPSHWPQTKKRRTYVYAPCDPMMVQAVNFVNRDTIHEASPVNEETEEPGEFGKEVDTHGWDGLLQYISPGLIF